MDVCPAMDADIADGMEGLVCRGGEVCTYQIIMLDANPVICKMPKEQGVFAKGRLCGEEHSVLIWNGVGVKGS